MSELAAAAALASLDDLDGALAARRERALHLQSLLPAGFERQLGHEQGTWQFVPVAAPDAETRERVLAAAAQRGIALRTYYEPLHAMPAFSAYEQSDRLGVTADLGRRILSLPMAVDLDETEIAAVADSVRAGASLPVGA